MLITTSTTFKRCKKFCHRDKLTAAVMERYWRLRAPTFCSYFFYLEEQLCDARSAGDLHIGLSV